MTRTQTITTVTCDRCGQVVPGDTPAARMTVVEPRSCDAPDREFDLCVACYDSLRRWGSGVVTTSDIVTAG